MSSSRDHNSFTGGARHLHRNLNGLAGIVGEDAPAEPTAEQGLVDIAFLDGQTRYFGNRGKDRLAVLRWTPDLALLWRI
jgi:hypothetical protein